MNIQRIIKAGIAHGYGQFVTIASTILIPATLAYHWGAEGFGYWVTLTALAQFFWLADVGTSSSLANQLCLKVNRSPSSAYALIKQVSARYFKNALVASVLVVSISVILSFFYSGVSEGRGIELGLAFLALGLSAIIQPLVAIYAARWRYQGKNEIGIFIAHTVRLFDFIAIIIAVMFEKTILAVALITLGVKLLLGLLIVAHLFYLFAKHAGKTLQPDVSLDVMEVNSSGTGFMVISLAQQITLHAPVVLLSVILGPVTAAIFSACRTLSRVTAQPVNALLASLNHDFTELIAGCEFEKLKIIVHRIFNWMVLLSLMFGVVALVYIEEINVLWLSGKVELAPSVLLPLLFAATFSIGGQVLNQALVSANVTRNQGRDNLVLSLIMVAIIGILLKFTQAYDLVAWVVCASELVRLGLLKRQYQKFLSQKHLCQ